MQKETNLLVGKAVALGNAIWKQNKKRWYVKLRLNDPIRYDGKDYETMILSSSRNQEDCKDIVCGDSITFTAYIRGSTPSNILADVKSYEGGSLERVKAIARKELAKYNS